MNNKLLILAALLLFIGACQNDPKTSANESSSSEGPKLEHLDWLTGNWQRINDDEGRKTYESWKKVSNQEYRGFGYTLAGEDTIFKENLNIVFKEEKPNYVVTGVNSAPTYFEFIGQDVNAFACTNPENEFPKNIEYIYQNDTIFATIMGGANSIVFVFVRDDY
ncbi:MAG: hypothetical protein DWQ02_24130 [Bacteroidetes bacterium]|nr:MAG: hypothetical protein DWQ02_24130 [Bacteroidota bacterium]